MMLMKRTINGRETTSFLDQEPDRSSRVPPPRFRWSTRVLLPTAILLVALSLLGIGAWQILAPTTPVRGVPVVLAATLAPHDANGEAPSTATATNQAGGTTVQAAGWVEPRPYAVFATALAEGVIAEILVLEGDPVTKGQPVATLVAADAEIALSRAQGEEAKAQAAVRAARATIESLVERDAALTVAEAKLAAANAALTAFASDVTLAESLLGEAEDEFTRKRDLADSGAIAPLELAKLGYRVDAQRAAVAALPARRAMLEAERSEADAMVTAARRARELLIEERKELGEAEAELELAKAGVREAELRLRRTRIEAPADGVVLARLVAPGMMVSPSPSSVDGGRVLSIYDPKELQIRADVPNADIALVGVGQTAEVRIEALPNATLRGEVLRITAQADIAKNTVQVKVRLIDPPPEVRPDMLCRVRILTGGSAEQGGGESARQRVFAPKALIRDGTAVVAGSLRDDLGRAERRKVELGGEERGAWIEVRSGLAPGDVLLEPSLADATRVRVTIDRSVEGPAGTNHEADGEHP